MSSIISTNSSVLRSDKKATPSYHGVVECEDGMSVAGSAASGQRRTLITPGSGGGILGHTSMGSSSSLFPGERNEATGVPTLSRSLLSSPAVAFLRRSTATRSTTTMPLSNLSPEELDRNLYLPLLLQQNSDRLLPHCTAGRSALNECDTLLDLATRSTIIRELFRPGVSGDSGALSTHGRDGDSSRVHRDRILKIACGKPSVRSHQRHALLDEYSRKGVSTNPCLGVKETSEMRQVGLLVLDKALALIPAEEKTAYTEAITRVPQLVKAESHPLRFLRCENYEAKTAAMRLVTYWEVRKELFGERAFLPLTQTGEGALTRDDIILLSSGSYAVLPNDASNRSVFYSDRSRLIKTSDVTSKARLRCLFYLMSVLSEDEVNQQEGYVWLEVLVTRYGLPDFNAAYARKVLFICERVMPVRLRAFHVLVSPPKSDKSSTELEAIVKSALNVIQEYCDGKGLVHVGDTPQDLLSKLVKFGLGSDGLPASAGGHWMFTAGFNEWQKGRCASERDFEGELYRDESFRGYYDEEQPCTRNAMSATERLRRKRKLNVIHSRQKRERRKAEVVELREKEAELQEEKKRLEMENKKLESQIVYARYLVSVVEGKESSSAV